jgi:hypothetical protein
MPEVITARRQLRLLAVAALEGANLGAVISSPGDWETPPDKLPAVRLRASASSKEPLAPGPSNYTAHVLLELETRVDATSAEQAQDNIEALDALVEAALLTNPALLAKTQNRYIDSAETEISADGKRHLAWTRWRIRLECVEVFDVINDAPASQQSVAVDLDDIDLQHRLQQHRG